MAPHQDRITICLAVTTTMTPDDSYDPDEPLEVDLTDDTDDEVLPCPACGLDVHEETEKCPYCGEWIMPLAAAAGRRHWIWILAAMLAIAGMIILTIF